MTQGRLVAVLGRTVRQQREHRSLTQQQLADRAGVSQATVARIENGERAASPAMLEKLLSALDVQLTVDVEPLDAHLDAQLAESAAKPLTERIEELELARAVDRLGDLPYVLTGGTAALLQGAPVPVEAVEIAVAWRDADAFTEWLTRSYGQRWHEQYQEFGYLPLDPREPGAHRWQTIAGEIRATMCDDLPDTIEVRHDGRSYRVVPLTEVELTDPRTAELLRRYRRQRTAAADADPADGGTAADADRASAG